MNDIFLGKIFCKKNLFAFSPCHLILKDYSQNSGSPHALAIQSPEANGEQELASFLKVLGEPTPQDPTQV
jgi:hypothetical protein